jgi:hypothetical protein
LAAAVDTQLTVRLPINPNIAEFADAGKIEDLPADGLDPIYKLIK